MICEKCGSRTQIFRSRPRSAFERAMVLMTPFRPYRCHRCNDRTIHQARYRSRLIAKVLPYVQGSLLLLALAAVLIGAYLLW